MSGGHWNYSHWKIREYLEEIGYDGQLIRRMPKLAQIFVTFCNHHRFFYAKPKER